MNNNIRVERAKKRISQKQLAKEVGLTSQEISKIENNKVDPRVGNAMKIAKVFDCDTEDLFWD